MNQVSTPWRSTRRSQGTNCVETRLYNMDLQIRDSKLPNVSPILERESNDFTALLNHLK